MGESYSQTATQPLDSPDIEDNTYEEEMLPQYWGRLYPAQRNVKFHGKNYTFYDRTSLYCVCQFHVKRGPFDTLLYCYVECEKPYIKYVKYVTQPIDAICVELYSQIFAL